MKIAVLIVAALLSIVVVIAGIGFSLPENHTARTRTAFKARPEVLWSAISNIEQFPKWRSDVDSVVFSPESTGVPKWTEVGSNGKIGYMQEEAVPPVYLRVKLTDDSLPFGGTWTYEIAPNATGSSLVITENGIVRNPIFRFVSRFVFGHYKTQETYLNDLGKRLNESVTPVRLTIHGAA